MSDLARSLGRRVCIYSYSTWQRYYRTQGASLRRGKKEETKVDVYSMTLVVSLTRRERKKVQGANAHSHRAGANAHSQQVTFSLTADIRHAPHPRIQCDLGGGNGRVCLERVARGSMKLGCYGGRWTPRCWTTRRLPATHRSRWAKWSFAYAACSQWCPQDKVWAQRPLPLGKLTGSPRQS